MPDRYYIYDDDESGITAIKVGEGISYIRGMVYSLGRTELSNLTKFFRDVEIPFKETSLRLAHDNFQVSYYIHQKHLSFLALMMSLEGLFNPSGEGELRYRISRNTAVLIGKDKDDSESIWKRMRKLYDIRCDIIHSGNFNDVNDNDVLELRSYVRRSIKEFYKIGKSKTEILDMLNSCGFGDKPWR